MLVNMHIKNLALIEEADIDFYEGLNILTGETGAGKSILLGSMNLALGEKIPKEMIRDESIPAVVDLVFQVDDPDTLSKLQELEIDTEDGCIILSRRIVSGRSIAKINGLAVTASLLRNVSAYLINIHGQHEHEILLKKKKHLEILDEYSKDKISSIKSNAKELYKSYINLKKEYESYSMDEEERIRQIEFLEFEINEIKSADLKIGEDEVLEAEYKKMQYAQKISSAIAQAYELIDEGQYSISESLSRAIRSISSVVEYDSDLDDINTQIIDISNLTNDLSRALSDYMSDMEFREEEFYEVTKRLDLINHLKSKYGRSIEDVIGTLEEKCDLLNKLNNYEEEKIRTKDNLNKALEELMIQYDKLSLLRQECAAAFEEKITESLEELNFNDVKFKVDFQRKEDVSADGIDDVEFLIRTNAGAELMSLSKIASGGELSRIMLAIKELLADTDEAATLIFDEIDTGISGRTAQMVSVKLSRISKKRQVICITHLPQIASMADAHFLIEKNVKDNVTKTNIVPLSYDESVNELARMLGGAAITEAVITNAKEMKQLAKERD